MFMIGHHQQIGMYRNELIFKLNVADDDNDDDDDMVEMKKK